MCNCAEFDLFETSTNNNFSLKVKAFSKFDSAISALDEVNAIIDGKVSTKLANLLAENAGEKKKTKLIVADPKLGMMLIKECNSMGQYTNKFNRECHQQSARSVVQDHIRFHHSGSLSDSSREPAIAPPWSSRKGSVRDVTRTRSLSRSS
jgi:hypothetical protein